MTELGRHLLRGALPGNEGHLIPDEAGGDQGEERGKRALGQLIEEELDPVDDIEGDLDDTQTR